MLVLMRILLALLLLTLHAHAAKVTLAWDYFGDPVEDAIAYYVLWQRVGNVWLIVKPSERTETTLELANGTYEFAVTAVDVWGGASEHSEPLSITVRGSKVR